MKKLFLRPLVLAAIILPALMLLNSCNDDNTDIGLNLLPGSDKIGLFADTIDVDCFTVTDFIVSTDERTLSPLGAYHDPVFGYTKAGFVCHARTSTSNVKFDSVVDNINSLELQLKYSSFYGDDNDAQTVKVYRLKKEIYFDSIYYSDFSLSESEYELLTETSLQFNAADSIIKIALPLELAEDFIDPLNESKFVDNTAFIGYFNGFYVTTNDIASGGCIYSLNLIHEDSRMVLYYNDTASYEFYINSKSAIINMFEHDYSTASAEVQAAIADTSVLRDLCYVQSLGGLKTKIKFPEIENYFDSTNIAINKAQLVVNVKIGNGEGTFAPPPKMTLVAITESGSYDFITDYKLNNTYFGGSLDSYTYRFNIPFHIQEILNGSEDYGIYLFANDNRTIPYRAVIHGNDDSENNMRLELYYSKF
jgi:hypothetical protein